jgi:dihydroorotate dehydrogenase (fumarate)/dihydroorotate dehydrogenase
MDIYKSFIRRMLFLCDPEWIHHTAIQAGRVVGKLGWLMAGLDAVYRVRDHRLETEVCGLRFDNPIGLAAGYDKSGEAIACLSALGFGHVEMGSVSADVSRGNPKPRLFRLPQDEAVVVHYGLQNDGAEVVAGRLKGMPRRVPLGINIVKTNRGVGAPADCEADILDDYARSIALLKDCGDYLTLNMSCPNTEMGRDFFAEKDHVVRFLTVLSDVAIRCPVFLKVSPLGGIRAIEDLLEAVDGFDFVSGFMFNLAPGKSVALKTPAKVWENMPGAVAGRPVAGMMNGCIRELFCRMDQKRYRIIGAGGVFTAEDAYQKIRLGASLVQILTGLVYEGPAVVRRINRGLCQLLERDGFEHVAEAVGSGSR